MKQQITLYLDNENIRNYDKNGRKLHTIVDNKIIKYDFDSLFRSIKNAEIKIVVNLQLDRDKLENMSMTTKLELFQFLGNLCGISEEEQKIIRQELNYKIDYICIIKIILQISTAIISDIIKNPPEKKYLPIIENVITLLTITDFDRIFNNFLHI